MPLDKRSALEYLERQAKPVTAKELATDLDSRASAGSELLERMATQGLVSREPNQRPREYALTEAGRKRLGFFRSRDGERSAPSDANAEVVPGRNPNLQPGVSASGVAPLTSPVDGSALSQKLDTLRDEVCSRLEALREDFRDLLDVLAANSSSAASAPAEDAPARIERVPSRADRILARFKKPTEEREDSDQQGRIQKLLEAHIAAERAGLFSRGRLRGEAEALESGLPPEIVEDVRALAEMEAFTLFRSDEKRAEIARLRERLNLPPEPAAGEKNEPAEVEQ